jgi:hypothetical protein
MYTSKPAALQQPCDQRVGTPLPVPTRRNGERLGGRGVVFALALALFMATQAAPPHLLQRARMSACNVGSRLAPIPRGLYPKVWQPYLWVSTSLPVFARVCMWLGLR